MGVFTYGIDDYRLRAGSAESCASISLMIAARNGRRIWVVDGG